MCGCGYFFICNHNKFKAKHKVIIMWTNSRTIHMHAMRCDVNCNFIWSLKASMCILIHVFAFFSMKIKVVLVIYVKLFSLYAKKDGADTAGKCTWSRECVLCKWVVCVNGNKEKINSHETRHICIDRPRCCTVDRFWEISVCTCLGLYALRSVYMQSRRRASRQAINVTERNGT